MTKEHAYAYEAGYQDGMKAANAEKATLLQKVEQLERDRKDYQATIDSLVDECTELEKENTGLKRWREPDSGHVDIGGIEVIETGSRLLTAEEVAEVTEHIERLETENAKLRWLANDMRACFLIGAERDGVSKQWCYELFDSYTDKLRELGIEEVG